MSLNPFFLQGAPGEQRLVQDLINEQLRMYGIEVTYIPRKYVRKQTIIQEIQSSKFDDNFAIEAYVNTYEGYSGAGDIMTKFGMSLKDEISLTISKERFEDFIAPFLSAMDEEEIEVSSRPREGDLVYFPLGQRLFEVKFVEHEKPFYQLGRNYVYELQCELFEYEDEVLDTTIDEIDKTIQETGYITTLNLIGLGQTATANSNLSSGYINEIFLNDDGYGYTEVPTVSISTAPHGGINATAVASIRRLGGVYSVDNILLTNAGSGYIVAPTITISGGNGSGAAATCSIEETRYGVISIPVTGSGVGYSTTPTVTVESPIGYGITATAVAVLNSDTQVSEIRITNPGVGYSLSSPPTVTIDGPPIISGVGNYKFNEIVRGLTSQTEGRVKEWDSDTNILKVSIVGIGSTTSGFLPGETVVGTSSPIPATASDDGYAIYSVKSYDNRDIYDKYDQNDEIEEEADNLLDFSESNPFGSY